MYKVISCMIKLMCLYIKNPFKSTINNRKLYPKNAFYLLSPPFSPNPTKFILLVVVFKFHFVLLGTFKCLLLERCVVTIKLENRPLDLKTEP